MHQSLVILPATKLDTTELNFLVNSAYRGESSKQGWTTEADILDGQRTDEEKINQMINPPQACILKALQNDQLIGCVYLEKNNDECYLGMLTVRPTLQDQGFGKSLLQAAEHHAKFVMKCKAITMTVISTRTELLKWYQRRGYTLTNEKKEFPMSDPRFGIPKVDQIEFLVLRKNLGEDFK